jgi:hypothetical protein
MLNIHTLGYAIRPNQDVEASMPSMEATSKKSPGCRIVGFAQH